mgnify:CR=1 FL=1
MNIAICDDEQIYADEIKKHVECYFTRREVPHKIYVFTDGQAAARSEVKFDIAFLDIEYYMAGDTTGQERTGGNSMEHIKVNSVSEAWRAAARIFPTDYEKNEENSKRAGYPIYETTSTDERFSGFHISDLNTRLEVNMGNETVTIWIEEDAFEIVVKGLTEEEKESLKEVVDKEIRRIKYRRHKAETSNLRYVIDLNS